MKENSPDITDCWLTGSELAEVQKILVEELGVKREQLTPEAALDADLGADSLSKVQIIMALEETFQVTVPDEVAEGVQTVEDVYDALAQTLGRGEKR